METGEEKLIQKYLNGECSEEERSLVENWYNEYKPASRSALSEEEWREDMRSIIMALENQIKPAKTIGWEKLLVAASTLLVLTFAAYFYLGKNHQAPQLAGRVKSDIAPGGNKAILTLTNGQKLVLNGPSSGNIAVQGNTVIDKTREGEITYSPGQGNKDAAHSYNTISTPRGGQYHVELADGTQVWLNAASSLTYPVSFTGNNREVSLSGEAYFEVAHDAKKPFHVKSGNQDIRVLGTHFNVNSYSDEPSIKTTLLEGSVRINGLKTLVPGEQSAFTGNSINIYPVDTEPVTAWKNNKFMFDHEDINGIMRMVARWYDVDISYSGEITQEKFGGSVSRFTNMSKVLGILQQAGNVHFKVEGRRITVTK